MAADSMLVLLLEQLGYAAERVIVHAGTRGTAIARMDRARELLTVVPGVVDDEVLQERRGWDLALRSSQLLETDEGPQTLIAEVLSIGVPSTTIASSPEHLPRFVTELADRMAAAHEAGLVVGPLQPALVFVDPDTLGLAGLAQRPLRADAAAKKGEGSSPLFGAAYLTPADARGESLVQADDVFRLASMIWRWRNGSDHLAGLTLMDQISTLAGYLSPVEEGAPAVADDLHAVLGRCLSLERDRRPSIGELQAVLRESVVTSD